jgi:hypothetical protein
MQKTKNPEDQIPEIPLSPAQIAEFGAAVLREQEGSKMESQALFQQGDLLVKWNVTSSQINQLAIHYRIKARTLMERREVSTIFPARRRDENIHYSVYRLLALRVHANTPQEAEERQDEILAERKPEDWTHDRMIKRLREDAVTINGNGKNGRASDRDSISLRGLSVNADFTGTRLIVNVERPPEGVELSKLVFSVDAPVVGTPKIEIAEDGMSFEIFITVDRSKLAL